MSQTYDKINCFALKGRLLFFAYGLDMDELTITVHYPNATRRTVACLTGHRLVYRNESSRWRSSIATIDRKSHEYVWGIVWELDTATLNSSNLFDVPGVLAFVEVKTIDGYSVICGTRQVVSCPKRFHAENYGDGAPTSHYVTNLVNAALQAQLPPPYIFALSTTVTKDTPPVESESESDSDDDLTQSEQSTSDGET